MASPIQFATAMKRVAKGVMDNADRAVRQSAAAMVYYLVPATPIRSGLARSNWRVGIDNPPDDVIESYSGARIGAGGEVASAGSGATAATVNAAIAVISNYNGDIHDSLHIVNNVPYLDKLNAGLSEQAEPGWIQEGIETGREAARSIRLI